MKIYREYRMKCELLQKNVLSEPIFRRIFNTDFNLSFARLKVDKCFARLKVDIESVIKIEFERDS